MSIKLMLIDDDDDDIKLFVDSAREVDSNIECIIEKDGAAGLKYLKDGNSLLPDYIFLDLRMPKINGEKCLEEIKKTERLKGIPVFVYSTSTDEKDILNLEKGGAIMFISKPKDTREVYYLISNIIGEKWI